MADERKSADASQEDAEATRNETVEAGGDAPTDKAAKDEKAEKDVKPEKAAKADRDEEAAKSDKADRPAGPAKPGKADKLKKADRPAGPVAPADEDAAEQPPRRALPTPAWVAICVATLVVGVLCGYFLLGGAAGGSISLDGRTTLSSGELDSSIASYTYNGRRVSVTARDVITSSGASLDSVANDDGTYNVPSASDVLAYAQNQIILDDAANRGITASDEEISDYAEQMLGSSDLASIASTYGIDEQTVRDTFEESVIVTKLRDAVCDVELPEQPTEPTEPEEGAEDIPTAEYADYIIALLGDEWDSEAGTWARTDGDYYATLSTYEITNDGATYAAAQAAYNVAYGKYSDAATQMSEDWSSYTTSLLSSATIQIGSLAES